MNTTKKRLTDDEFVEVIRVLREWKERDRLRSVKYQEFIKELERRGKRRLIIGVSINVVILGILLVLMS